MTPRDPIANLNRARKGQQPDDYGFWGREQRRLNRAILESQVASGRIAPIPPRSEVIAPARQEGQTR